MPDEARDHPREVAGKAASLRLAGWTLDLQALAANGALTFWRITLPAPLAAMAHRVLSGKAPRPDRNIPHLPFEAALADVAPAGTFVRGERIRAGDDVTPTVRIYYPAESTDRDAARRATALGLRDSFEIIERVREWPETVPKRADLVGRIAQGLDVEEVSVSTELTSGRVSAVPSDRLAYAAVQSLAMRRAHARRITAPREAFLTPSATGVGEFAGAEALCLPLVEHPERDEWMADRLTLTTATLAGLHGPALLLDVGVRRWRPLRDTTSESNYARTIDVMPVPKRGDAPRWHSMRPRSAAPDLLNATIAHLLSRGAKPVERLPDEAEPDFMSGRVEGAMPQVAPRSGSLHGDRFLRIGAGSSHPDREAFMDEVEAAIGPGLVPLGRATRVAVRRAVPFAPAGGGGWRVEPGPDMAQALAAALTRYGAGRFLRVVCFEVETDFAAGIRAAFEAMLGPPARPWRALPRARNRWTAVWGAAGRRVGVCLTVAKSGPLATRLPIQRKKEHRQEVEAGLEPGLGGAERGERIEAAWSAHVRDGRRRGREDIAGHVAVSAPKVPEGRRTGVAFVQMPSDLAHDEHRDPLRHAKQALAVAGYVTQGALCDAEPARAASHKPLACVADALRMLGVPGFRAPSPAPSPIPSPIPSPVAATRCDPVRRPVVLASPVAIRKRDEESNHLAAVKVVDGATFVAFAPASADASARPRWLPYPAALRLLSAGQAPRIQFPSTKRRDDGPLLFLRDAITDLDRTSEYVLLLVNAANIRTWLHTVQNRTMRYDLLEFSRGETGQKVGMYDLRPSDIPATRLLRYASERGKTPSYILDRERTAPHRHRALPAGAGPHAVEMRRLREQTTRQQAMSGLFAPGYAADDPRIRIAIKARPKSMAVASLLAAWTRHGRSNNLLRDTILLEGTRASPAADEVVAAFLQPGDDADGLVAFVEAIRDCHVQFLGDTRLPPPLHEADLLRKAVFGPRGDGV